MRSIFSPGFWILLILVLTLISTFLRSRKKSAATIEQRKKSRWNMFLYFAVIYLIFNAVLTYLHPSDEFGTAFNKERIRHQLLPIPDSLNRLFARPIKDLFLGPRRSNTVNMTFTDSQRNLRIKKQVVVSQYNVWKETDRISRRDTELIHEYFFPKSKHTYQLIIGSQRSEISQTKAELILEKWLQ